MTGAPHRVLVQAAIFLAICMAALGSFGYAVWERRTETETKTTPLWRRIVAASGFVAVAAQAVFFAAFWTRIGRDYVLFGRWARWVLPTFLVAVACVLAGRGASRWWLLLSSVFLFVICFFIVLSA